MLWRHQLIPIMPKPSINSIFGIFSISNWVNFNICALHRQLMNECRKNLQFIAFDAHFQFALIQIQIQRIQNTVSHLYVVLLGMNWIRVVRFQRWKIFQENSFDHFFLICSIFLWNFFSFVLPMMTISKQQTRSKQCRKNQITTFLILLQRNFFVDDWYDLFFCARVLFGNFTNCFCVCFGNSFTHAFDLNVWACSLMHKNVQTLSVANCVHVFVCVVYLTDVMRSIVSEIQFCQKKL